MTNEYGFFSSLDHDRAYSAEDFCSFFRDFFTDGVLGGNTGELKVSADSGMSVRVTPGTAYIDGRFYRPTEIKHLTLRESDSIYPRKDIVVIRCDYAARRVLVDVVEGVASPSPKAPELTRNGTAYELCIAEIYIGASALEITDADITDTRFDTDLCGIVTGAIDTIDTTELFKQYQTAWDLLVAGMELDEPNIIKAFESLNVAKTINSVAPVNGNVPLSMDNIYSGKNYPKYTVQFGSGTFEGLSVSGTVDIAFEKPFKSKPVVFAAIHRTNTATAWVYPTNISTTGFTADYSGNHPYSWVAFGDVVPEWEGAVPDAELTHVETGQMHSLTKEEIARAFNKGGN